MTARGANVEPSRGRIVGFPSCHRDVAFGITLNRGSPYPSAVLSMTYTTLLPVAGQALPSFTDSGGLRIVPDGSSMHVELDVYDRALGHTRKLTRTFTGCAATTNRL